MSDENQDFSRKGHNLDPDELVRAIMATHSGQVREELARRILEIVQRICRRRVREFGLGGTDPTDLAEGAAGHIFLMLLSGKFNPEKGRFVPWAATLADNYIKDQLRRRAREIPMNQLRVSAEIMQRATEEGFNVLEWLASQSAHYRGGLSISQKPSEQISLFDLPFAEDDLAAVSRWKPLRDRLIMLVLSGLWRKVPEHLWNEWGEEARLPKPFPPSEILYLDDKERRLKPLAEALGLTPNHLCVIWKRREGWLKKLRCIRELAEAYGHGNTADVE